VIRVVRDPVSREQTGLFERVVAGDVDDRGRDHPVERRHSRQYGRLADASGSRVRWRRPSGVMARHRCGRSKTVHLSRSLLERDATADARLAPAEAPREGADLHALVQQFVGHLRVLDVDGPPREELGVHELVALRREDLVQVVDAEVVGGLFGEFGADVPDNRVHGVVRTAAVEDEVVDVHLLAPLGELTVGAWMLAEVSARISIRLIPGVVLVTRVNE